MPILNFFHSIINQVTKFKISLPLLLGHTSFGKSRKEESILYRRPYKFFDKISALFSTPNIIPTDNLITLTRKPLKAGLLILAIFFGIFGVWAAFAPLDGAVMSRYGQVVLSSKQQVVQHLEGGVVEKILVKEGEVVEKGDPLVYLRDISVKANFGVLQERLMLLKATEVRLSAELEEAEELQFPHSLLNELSEVRNKDQILHNQSTLFKNRREILLGQTSILTKRIEQTRNEQAALNSQLTSVKSQVTLVKEDLDNKKDLYSKGYIGKPQVLALERELTTLLGKLGEIESYIAKAEQRVAETMLEIIQLKNEFNTKIINELKETNSAAIETEERLIDSRDRLERMVIRAPQSGKITGLTYHTVGGIIPPGTTIMSIVPNNENLIIEAQIAPNDIEAVITAQSNKKNFRCIDGSEGIRTKVRLTAYSSRKLGLLEGIMTYVSADIIKDMRSGAQFYVAHVTIPAVEIKKIKSKVKLYPGMPAMVYIVTESRTLLSYLLTPITASFDNAFNEK